MPAPVTRNLTIVLTDIKGFTDKTSHKSRVEIQTLLDRHKEIVLPILEGRGGRLVKTMGDAFLATFESPTNAVLAGMEAQAALAAYNMGRKAEDRIEIRVAINQGEVNEVDNDIFGEPVNITARIEAVADAGDVFFTEAIYLAMNKKEVPSSEVGLLQLKGIPQKVRVYRVKQEHPVEAMGGAAAYLAERPAEPPAEAPEPAPEPAASSLVPSLGASAAVIVVALAVVLMRGRKPGEPAAPPRASATFASRPTSAASAPASVSAPAPAAGSAEARSAGRTYPSIFMAWEHSKRNPDPMVREADLARNDLIFAGAPTFNLKWNGPEGQAEEFTPESLLEAQALRRGILGRNPNAVLLLDVRYETYIDNALPADHAWWRRDGKGGRVQAWAPGYWRLDFSQKSLQDHAVAQCRAAVRSGVVDGCELNVWDDDDDRLALLKKMRAAVGEEALLVANSGKDLPLSAPLLNGQVFNMTHRYDEAGEWAGFARRMTAAQTHLRAPRVIGFQLSPAERRPELLRLATTMVLTHFDGYALYQPAGAADPAGDDWPPFWNKSLGRPLEPGQPRDGGSTSREFQHGTVVYNPPGAPPAKLAFTAARTSAATGRKDRTFTLASGDGDLYLK